MTVADRGSHTSQSVACRSARTFGVGHCTSAWRPRSPPGMHTQDLTYSWHVAVMLLSVRCSHGRAVLPARPSRACAAPLRARAPPSHAVARGGGGTNLTESSSSTSDSVREASRGANQAPRSRFATLGGFARRRKRNSSLSVLALRLPLSQLSFAWLGRPDPGRRCLSWRAAAGGRVALGPLGSWACRCGPSPAQLSLA